MVRVELMRFGESDLHFGKRLTDAEEWGRSESDWERLLRLGPLGFFKAVVDDHDAGMAALLVYPQVAWIHSVIVDRPYRRTGVATALMVACLSYAQARGIHTVKLDAVQGYADLYRKVGFREEFVSHRFFVETPDGRKTLRLTAPSVIDEVCEFDLEATRLDRSAVLRDILGAKDCGCVVGRRAGRLVGYAIWRAEGDRSAVGPCVVDPQHADAAASLMADALRAAPDARCRICVPGYNTSAIQLVRSFGGEESTSSMRMRRGPEVRESDACYAMIGPEMG